MNTVYKASEQVISVIAQKQPFYNNPVLIEYPTPGVWAVAFNTGEIDFKEFTDGKKRFTVFIPTTPNPTSGFMAIIPEDKLKKLDINAEDALKLILTGGIIKNINEEMKFTKK
ncbi:MAG: DUF502 domain-containing protein [Spirochaetes bacterium]|nr:DUF502 domain-containing protein [Spirochaetota bacterium]